MGDGEELARLKVDAFALDAERRPAAGRHRTERFQVPLAIGSRERLNTPASKPGSALEKRLQRAGEIVLQPTRGPLANVHFIYYVHNIVNIAFFVNICQIPRAAARRCVSVVSQRFPRRGSRLDAGVTITD
jgi:hypothetical protein